MRQSKTESEEQLKLVGPITSKVQNDVEDFRKRHDALEKNLVASRKTTAVLKRKLNRSQKELNN
jgi:septal ring factor EnvC (AmiA/AmiB activator)